MPDENKFARDSKPSVRIVQIELRVPLRRLGVRAKSESPFRFAVTTGEELTELHRALNDHAVGAAHASFRLRHPRQRRRRSQQEKDHLSRFVDLHFPTDSDVATIVRRLRALPGGPSAVKPFTTSFQFRRRAAVCPPDFPYSAGWSMARPVRRCSRMPMPSIGGATRCGHSGSFEQCRQYVEMRADLIPDLPFADHFHPPIHFSMAM